LRRVFNIITEVMKNRLLSEEAVGADNFFWLATGDLEL
jgi:hypothetical protein